MMILILEAADESLNNSKIIVKSKDLIGRNKNCTVSDP